MAAVVAAVAAADVVRGTRGPWIEARKVACVIGGRRAEEEWE